jgi:hypothetical protein
LDAAGAFFVAPGNGRLKAESPLPAGRAGGCGAVIASTLDEKP